MTAFLLIGSGVAAVCALRAMATGGWSAWLGPLVAVATFGGDPVDPWRAVLTDVLTFTAVLTFRRAL